MTTAASTRTAMGVASRLLDGYAHQASPLGPRAIVILDVLIAEQVGEHKPGVAAALANTAVRHHPLVGCDALALVQGTQLLGAFEGAIGVDGLAPRNAPGTRDVSGALRSLLLIADHSQELTAILLRRAHVHQRLAVGRVHKLAQHLV